MASVVNDDNPLRGEREIDLARLNEAELRVLRMLGEGHTAKSIAASLDSTEAAVNERLREARRKTGVGSSRELARLLKAQENRHEQIGVARRRRFIPFLPPWDAEPWRPQTGVIAMLALFTVAVAAGVALSSQQQPGGEQTAGTSILDPQLGRIDRHGPAWLYPMLRQEPRDESWAPGAERALRERYSAIQFYGMKPTVLRVTCARTLCEVAAAFGLPGPKREYSMDLALVADMKKIGLLHHGEMIGNSSDPARGIYLAYYMRAH